MNGPIQRPRPKVMGSMNPVLRDRKPKFQGGGQAPGIVPSKMAAGANEVRKRTLQARSLAAQKMKGTE